jgi:hypothetical protein
MTAAAPPSAGAQQAALAPSTINIIRPLCCYQAFYAAFEQQHTPHFVLQEIKE